MTSSSAGILTSSMSLSPKQSLYREFDTATVCLCVADRSRLCTGSLQLDAQANLNPRLRHFVAEWEGLNLPNDQN